MKTKWYFEDNLYQMPATGPDIALLEMDKPVPNEAKFGRICLPASNNFPDTPLHSEVFCQFFHCSSLKLVGFKESVERSHWPDLVRRKVLVRSFEQSCQLLVMNQINYKEASHVKNDPNLFYRLPAVCLGFLSIVLSLVCWIFSMSHFI